MKPAWQRHPLFQFFCSVRLAMLLIAVLIAAIITGTLCESSFDARVARAYIYNAPWFNAWMLLLAANLTCSALSRMPWKRHHTGFLLTHLGIIVLLTGALIGRLSGVEGSITLFKGEPPSSLLVTDQHVLEVTDPSGAAITLPLEMINRHPSPDHPWPLTTTPGGWEMAAVDYSAALDVKLTARPISSGGAPALHVTLSTARMGQSMNSWLIADSEPDHATFDLGLAQVQLRTGVAPPVSPAESMAADLEETIFAFANPSAGQVARVLRGGSTGARAQVIADSDGQPAVQIQIGAARQQIEARPGAEAPVPLTPFTVHIDHYWPDFIIKDGQPGTASANPKNPCVLLTVRGHAVPQPAAADSTHATTTGNSTPDTASHLRNQLTLFAAPDGSLSYRLESRLSGISTGKLDLNHPLPTGWADWTLLADRSLASAAGRYEAESAPPSSHTMHAEGVKIRASRSGSSFEQWVPLGWQIAVPAEPHELLLAYGNKQIPLPIGLQLKDFQIDWNEGTDTPAGFKSTLDVTDAATGQTVTGQCWMNHPMSVPDSWFATLTGLTYKLSQASWNPQNLSQSSIQILRDPGWAFKWIGSLVFVSGVFTLFYLRPHPGSRKSSQRTPPTTQQAQPPRKTASAILS